MLAIKKGKYTVLMKGAIRKCNYFSICFAIFQSNLHGGAVTRFSIMSSSCILITIQEVQELKEGKTLEIGGLEVIPPPNPPTRASIFEPLLDYLGRSNLVWKLYSTKLDQLAN